MLGRTGVVRVWARARPTDHDGAEPVPGGTPPPQGAERRARDAERARDQLAATLAEISADRDTLLRNKGAVWKEKKALELKTLQRRLDDRNRTLYGTQSERRGRRTTRTTSPPASPAGPSAAGADAPRSPSFPSARWLTG